jgi:hypothetical protein
VHHLLAYNSTLAAIAGYQQVGAVADAFVPRDNAGTSYQMPADLKIVGAYGGAAANVRTRLSTPSVALRGNAQVIPISGTLLAAVDPNFMDMTACPLDLRNQEALRADMESNSATNALVAVWVLDPKTAEFKVEFRDLRWIRFTAAVTTVANVWATGATLTFEDSLEGGTYAVYGMQAFFATSLLARLIFPGQVMRPGCLGQATAVSRSAPAFWGGLGLWGKFDTFSPPIIEVMDTAAAGVTYTGWLLASKVNSKAGGGSTAYGSAA